MSQRVAQSLGTATPAPAPSTPARAAVDVQPPLDKLQANKYTRFLARKLMDGMTTTWSAPPAKKEAP